MRIAIFTDTYSPEINGVARTLDRLTRYLKKEGIDYRVFAPESSTTVPLVPQVKRFASLPFFLYPECRLALPNPIKINQILDEFKPTLIHIATPFNLGIFGMKYGKKHHIPMVASYHTHFDEYLKYYHIQFLDKWIWNYMRWFHRPFQKVYVPSESTRRKVLEHQVHSQIEIWGRGVDHQLFSPAKKSSMLREKYNIKEEKIVLYVGRIAPEKDIHLVLETFQSLPKELQNNTHLVVAGDGPLYKSLSTQYSSSLDHNKNITLTGFVEGELLAQLYASADVFFFPSATETFGNVVLEALASGLPIVASRAGGVQHLVKERETGLLCSPHDILAFRKALLTLLIDPDLCSTLGRQARASTMNKTWDHIFTDLVASYKETKSLVYA